MRNGKAVFLGVALTILGGAGLIFGNQILASNVLVSGNQTEPAIVMPENDVLTPASAMKLSNVGIYSNTEGKTYMALTNGNADIQQKQDKADTSMTEYQNPTDGKLSEEEAKQIGISAIADKYGLTQKDIDASDVQVRGFYDSQRPSDEAGMLVWLVQLIRGNPEDYPAIECYHATVNDQTAEMVKVSAIPDIREETPLENEISSDKAEEIGIAALTKKYALTQETLYRFTVTTKYYEVTSEAPGKHVWWVSLYPTNTDEFAEIGCYWTYIDAETGDALQLMSAVDGKG